MDPTQVLVPATGSSQVFTGDEGESDLDLEWSGAMATGANIIFVYTGNNMNNAGVFDSITYSIDQKIGNIISASYGLCETLLAPTDFLALDAVLKQGTAQGQTVVAASGDAGSTACWSGQTGTGQPTIAQQQALAVNYPASSQYVTGIGGTEVSQANSAYTTSGSAYWAAASGGNDQLTSALQYLPEVVWNDSILSSQNGGGLSATGGGVSTFYTSKPSWQTGVPGIPNDNQRDVPDVSLYSSPDLVGYLFCTSDQSNWSTGQTSSCSQGFRDNSGMGILTVAGGTSFATPIFAGMIAIMNQDKGYAGGQGFLNGTLYSLASNATTYSSGFHDGSTARALGTTRPVSEARWGPPRPAT